MQKHRQEDRAPEKTRLNVRHSIDWCILSNGEVIKYHNFISVVVIELSARCLNTGPEDRLGTVF